MALRVIFLMVIFSTQTFAASSENKDLLKRVIELEEAVIGLHEVIKVLEKELDSVEAEKGASNHGVALSKSRIPRIAFRESNPPPASWIPPFIDLKTHTAFSSYGPRGLRCNVYLEMLDKKLPKPHWRGESEELEFVDIESCNSRKVYGILYYLYVYRIKREESRGEKQRYVIFDDQDLKKIGRRQMLLGAE